MESSNPDHDKLNTPATPAELRRSSAEFRRAQMEQIRAMVRARIYQHHEQRQQLAQEPVRPRTDWRTIQTEIRAKLKQISAEAGKIRHAYQEQKRVAATSRAVASTMADEASLAKRASAGGS